MPLFLVAMYSLWAQFASAHFVVAVTAEGLMAGIQVAQGPDGDCIFQDGFDCPTAPEELSAAGSVLDYWTLSPVPGALVITLSPPLIDVSDMAGEYLLEGFDPESSVVIKASRTPGHRETNNPGAQIGEQSVNLDTWVAAEADLARQFASVGIVRQCDAAIVVADMRDPDGLPLEGVPLADVVLTDGAMQAIGDGPYYFGAAGDIVDPGFLNISTAFLGRGARVAFLNVPIGPAVLSVFLPAPQTSISVDLVVERDVIHLLVAE